jgi:putative peptide zinc metalloprotease protein
LPQPTQGEQSREQPQPPPNGNGGPPQLAEGIELVGEYQDSGYKKPPFVARRADGQMIQMPELLYRVAEQIDGRRSYAEIGERASDAIGRGINDEAAQFLIDEKLRPLGVVTGPNGEQPIVQKVDPLLALKFKTAVVPARVTRALTTIFLPFFWPPVLIATLLAVVAVDVWYFFVHGVAQSARELAYNPILLLMVLGLVVVATALHEIGHATAARYGGAEPGVMGMGIYIVWPAFYTDVTDAYRLGRGGRLRTDLGGVYFNGLFVLLIAGAYAVTGFEPLLILIIVQHFQVLQQFLPFLRLDGYYILSDLVGVPDMFARLKPTLKSALPGQETDERADELKPWVRRVVTGWVVALIPILGAAFGLLVFNLPRMFATAWDSLFVQLDKVQSGGGLTMVAGSVQTVALLLPLAGGSYTIVNIVRRVATGAWSWSEDAPVRRALVLATTVVTAGVAGWVLFPNGDYRPIQPNERGTLQGGFRQFASVHTGRPGLTPEREQELGGAPVVRDAPAEDDREEQPSQTAPTATSEEPATTTGETTTTETTTTPAATTPAETAPTDTTLTTTTPTTTTETTP